MIDISEIRERLLAMESTDCRRECIELCEALSDLSREHFRLASLVDEIKTCVNDQKDTADAIRAGVRAARGM